jgi:hypothetical protein
MYGKWLCSQTSGMPIWAVARIPSNATSMSAGAICKRIGGHSHLPSIIRDIAANLHLIGLIKEELLSRPV